MSSSQPRVVSVRNGEVRPSGSWLYVWIDVNTGVISYVGGTRLDPELRAYLHMTSDDSQLGRVRATVPRYDERDFDVLAFELTDGIDRARAKQALIARLSDAGEAINGDRLGGDLRDVIDPIVQAIVGYRTALSPRTTG